MVGEIGSLGGSITPDVSLVLLGAEATISAAGTSIWDETDSLFFAKKIEMFGNSDFVMTVKFFGHIVNGQPSGTNARRKAGLMIRKSMDPSSQHFSIVHNAEAGICIQYRTNFNERTNYKCDYVDESTAPFLKLVKRGNSYDGLYSVDDGSTYIYLGTSDLDMSAVGAASFGSLEFGIVALSNDNTSQIKATFRYFNIEKKEVRNIEYL